MPSFDSQRVWDSRRSAALLPYGNHLDCGPIDATSRIVANAGVGPVARSELRRRFVPSMPRLPSLFVRRHPAFSSMAPGSEQREYDGRSATASLVGTRTLLILSTK
jgi:hypothetical protein